MEMPSPTEKAIIELNAAFADMDDYCQLPIIYQDILTEFLHVDWLAFYCGPILPWIEPGSPVSVASTCHLPDDWNARYNEIVKDDCFAMKIFDMPIGQPLLYEDLRPFDEKERMIFEFVRKYSGTNHYMVMPTGKGTEGYSTFGLYRTDPQNGFSEDDRQFFMKLGPTLRSSIKMLMLYKNWDLMRVSYEKIFETEKIRPIIMDLNRNIISYPLNTLNFLREALKEPLLEDLPEFIKKWIQNEILPEYRLLKLRGPWQTTTKAASGNITCRAYQFQYEFKKPILVITFNPHETSVDFTALSKAGISKREIEALSYLPLGYTNRQIAMAMHIKEITAKKHLKNVARKLGAYGRTETLYRAIQKKNLLESLAL